MTMLWKKRGPLVMLGNGLKEGPAGAKNHPKR